MSRALVDTLLAAWLLSIAFLSATEQSAAQMFRWPWVLLYALGSLAPLLALAIRVGDRARPLTLPSSYWFGTLSLLGLGLVVSTALSPLSAPLGIWLAQPLSLLAGVLLVADTATEERGRKLLAQAMGVLGVGVSAVSLLMWISDRSLAAVAQQPWGERLPSVLERLRWLFEGRNTQPLGHANYTAGSALLFLPWLTALAWQARGAVRLLWGFGAAACFLMFLSGGSRGAWIGLLALALAATALLWNRGKTTRQAIVIAACLGALVAGIVGAASPALRDRFRPRSESEAPNASNAERRTMARIGWKAGVERPLLGWGQGAVPYVYETYRGAETYGPTHMLQVHSTPLQLWAEGGVLLVGAWGLLVLLVGRSGLRLVKRARESPAGVNGAETAAFLGLVGYGVFALTDYQLDLPLVTLGVAVSLGVLASAEKRETAPPRLRLGVGVLALGGLALLVTCFIPWLQAKRALHRGDLAAAIAAQPDDPTLYVLAGLRSAEASRWMADPLRREKARTEAVTFLRAAIEAGSPREICHFNLGGLLLETDPAAASKEFQAVLDIAVARQGAWLGVGLAELAKGDPRTGVAALANEALAHPAFLVSGWWLDPRLESLRPAVLSEVDARLGRLLATLRPGRWPESEAKDFLTTIRWMRGIASAADAKAVATTPARQQVWGLLSGATAAANSRSAETLSTLLADPLRVANRVQARYETLQRGPVDVAWRKALVEFLRQSSARETLASILTPRRETDVWITGSPGTRPGFAIRMRNPYAYGMIDVLSTLRNAGYEVVLDGLLPAPGWFSEDYLRRFAQEDRENAATDGKSL